MQTDTTQRPVLEPLYTLQELTRLAKRSRRSLERDIAVGELRVIRLGPRAIRITTREALRYLTGGGDGTTG